MTINDANDVLRAEARAAFAALVKKFGDALPLDRATALLAAEERPGLAEPDVMLAQLDDLAGRIHLRDDAGVFEAVARINHLLFEELGFRGDEVTYDDPQNSLLDRVLSRRAGLPILLSVVYIEVARRIGQEVDPISFPMHFLVAPADAEPRFFVDPFNAGRVIREEQLRSWLCQMMDRSSVPEDDWLRVIRPTPRRQVLVRVNNNLRGTYVRLGDHAGALRAIERTMLLLDDAWEARRDRGLLLLEMERTDEARDELRAYLLARPEASDAGQIARRLRLIEASAARTREREDQ